MTATSTTTTGSTPRRIAFLTVLAAAIGLAAGGAAWVLVHLIGLVTNLALFHRVGWTIPSFSTLHRSVWIVVAAAVGGLLVSLLAMWSPVIRGHGIPEAMEAVLTRQSRIAPRAAVAKPLSAAISIGTGGPFGAEGPIIVTGGALGSLVGQVLPVSPSERKILLAAGAAAGMAATFGTPVAAVVLAIELLLFELSPRAFVPLVVASAFAGGVHQALFGAHPFLPVPAHDLGGLAALPFFALLGLACGVGATVVAKGLFAIETGFRRLPLSVFWHPILGGAAFALVALIQPRALGVGYDAIGDVLAGRLALGAVAVLAIVKLVAWWIALGSGTSGGTLAPLLLIGASFGSVLGVALGHLAPGLGVPPEAYALVAMAAIFGAATRASFTSIVFVLELTGQTRAVLPLMVATVLADLVAGALLHESLMTEKLARRGLRVHRDYQVDAFRAVPVRQLMSTHVDVIDAAATVGEARQRIAGGAHSAFPVVDASGALAGVVSRRDLLQYEDDPATPLLHLASRDVVAVRPDDTAAVALQRLAEEHVTHLPVVDEDRLVGICTASDLLRARSSQFEHDRRQPGLLGRRHPVPAPNLAVAQAASETVHPAASPRRVSLPAHSQNGNGHGAYRRGADGHGTNGDHASGPSTSRSWRRRTSSASKPWGDGS